MIYQFETKFFKNVLENLAFLKKKIAVNDRISKEGQSQKKIKPVSIIDDLLATTLALDGSLTNSRQLNPIKGEEDERARYVPFFFQLAYSFVIDLPILKFFLLYFSNLLLTSEVIFYHHRCATLTFNSPAKLLH
jgi:hypothetical protein